MKIGKDEGRKMVKLTSREKRFIRFASVEYDGQIYMTPIDFLESVIQNDPRPRLKRKVLDQDEIVRIQNATPSLNQGSKRLFRTLGDIGIVSYTEYLFLQSILTKPQSGFCIAFNMFDTDGNEKVDKTEFLVLEKIISRIWREKGNMVKSTPGPQERFVNDEQGLQKQHTVNTTLIVHLFGPSGERDLDFEDFEKFMLNLQREILEFEFTEYSKGQPTISELDFANILLRYTSLDANKYDVYLDRVLDRTKASKGITFEEYYVFCQFLNNLEDFTVAMRMLSSSKNQLISKDEFHRAVKVCTGTNLSEDLIQTVFAIFDADGDGNLSYDEFIAIMKDRLKRGFKSYADNKRRRAFKTCIKHEMNFS